MRAARSTLGLGGRTDARAQARPCHCARGCSCCCLPARPSHLAARLPQARQHWAVRLQCRVTFPVFANNSTGSVQQHRSVVCRPSILARVGRCQLIKRAHDVRVGGCYRCLCTGGDVQTIWRLCPAKLSVAAVVQEHLRIQNNVERQSAAMTCASKRETEGDGKRERGEGEGLEFWAGRCLYTGLPQLPQLPLQPCASAESVAMAGGGESERLADALMLVTGPSALLLASDAATANSTASSGVIECLFAAPLMKLATVAFRHLSTSRANIF